MDEPGDEDPLVCQFCSRVIVTHAPNGPDCALVSCDVPGPQSKRAVLTLVAIRNFFTDIPDTLSVGTDPSGQHL